MIQGSRPTECILWQGGRGPKGYGSTRFKGVVTGAHRAAYCGYHNLELSDIAGQVVRHKCDVRACVNPEHLVIGTQLDNMHDMSERGRKVVAVGNALPQAKLTPWKVRRIRMLLAVGHTQADIAELMNTSQPNVSAIKHRKAWAHVS